MLSSLFGETSQDDPNEGLRRLATRRGADPVAMVGVSTIAPGGGALRDLGESATRPGEELFLTGSVGAALRMHLAGSGEAATDPQAIALFDPVRMWAPALLKSLSDTGGQPVERLVLRDAAKLTTLATIERTRVVRRFEDALTVYHADVPSGVADSAAVPAVLMERAQLAAVIVGPMHPESVTGMLEMLLAATHADSWRCPNLLFMLPPAAVWIANKVSGMGWPQPMHVTVLNESLNGTSAVWNALLGIWKHAQGVGQWTLSREPQAEALEPIHVETPAAEAIPRLRIELPPEAPRSAEASAGAPAAGAPRAPLAALDMPQVALALQDLVVVDGVLACALIDAGSGLALAHEARERAAIDIEVLAAAATQVLRGHRLAARQSGFTDPIEEITLSAGSRQQLLRLLARHPGLFLCAVLDAHRGNLALTRYRLLEIEHALA